MPIDWTNISKKTHPGSVTSEQFPFLVKISHTATGHIYIRPASNLKPFTQEQEKKIIEILNTAGLNGIRQVVMPNFTTKATSEGYGFRIVNL